MCIIGNYVGYLQKDSVIAWRAWRLSKTGGLRSTSQNTYWRTPHKRVAYFQHISEHGVYGFWAFRSRAACQAHFKGEGVVIGQVRLSGLVAKHTGGYRGQRCEILGLVNRPTLAARLGVRKLV